MTSQEANAMIEDICWDGIGYMANTGPAGMCNARAVHLDPRKDGVGAKAIFLLATKDLEANSEVFFHYGNKYQKDLLSNPDM
jgi:hypothetical protein